MVMFNAFKARGRFNVILPHAPETRTKTSLIVSIPLEILIGSCKLCVSIEDDDLPNPFSRRQTVKAYVKVLKAQTVRK